MTMYVDVHTHLTHEQFNQDCDAVILRARAAGLGAIVVNGLEPHSNRQILQMAQQYPEIKPALGIYPLDAVNHLLPADFPHRIGRFDVEDELQFIDAQAPQLHAIGECGLDGHWLDASTFAEQERVFHRLIDIALKHDRPLIIHTRKCEQRAMDILRERNVTRVDFHCFGGKTKLAQHGAEQHGWWFSIPAHASRSDSFKKMLRTLPPEKILTETDAPYLAPTSGARNEPANVVGTIALLATLRGWSEEQAKQQVWTNYRALFN